MMCSYHVAAILHIITGLAPLSRRRHGIQGSAGMPAHSHQQIMSGVLTTVFRAEEHPIIGLGTHTLSQRERGLFTLPFSATA